MGLINMAHKLSTRIAVLELKTNHFDVQSMTDEELLDFIGLPGGATDEQLQAIINKGASYDK